MTNQEFAEELVRRLNELCESPTIRRDIGHLIREHIPCSLATADHPTIVVAAPLDGSEGYVLGLLGLLNGVVGELDGGKTAFAAVYPDTQAAGEYDTLVRFALNPVVKKGSEAEMRGV